jgi:hypothetical protein
MLLYKGVITQRELPMIGVTLSKLIGPATTAPSVAVADALKALAVAR